MAFILMTGLAACAGNTAPTPSAPDAASSEISASDTSASEDAQAAASAAESSTSAEPVSAASASDEAFSEPESSDEAAEPQDATNGKGTLVVVFSATGTTLGVAEKIAAIEDADLYEIKAAQEYTSADLNWNDSGSRSTKEQNDKSVRPEIGSERVSLEGYDTIYIGFPIWWGEEPRIMDTFVESYDFGGITLIPFCTSSSSGIGRSGQNLAENARSGNWLDGRRFSGNVSESELQEWIGSLK